MHDGAGIGGIGAEITVTCLRTAIAVTRLRIAPAATKDGNPGAPTTKPKARPRALARPVAHRSHGTLRCSRGRWSNHPTRFTYRWKIGSGAFGSPRTSARLAVPARSHGRTVTCQVTASNAKGSARASSRALKVP